MLFSSKSLQSMMIKSANLTFGVAVLSLAAFLYESPAYGQSPQDIAAEEEIRRQAKKVELAEILEAAQEKQSGGDLIEAGKYYNQALIHIESIGGEQVAEARATAVTGFTAV